MKLNVFGTVAAAYAFGLRHFPAFYLLVVVVGLPHYLYGQLPCPEWQATVVAGTAETLISCAVVALMAATLSRDRRGGSWTVLRGVRDTAARSVTVLGVSVTITAYVIGLTFLGDALRTLHPLAPIVVLVLHFIIEAFLCMALPCAAVETRGVIGCFRRSIVLSAGSRLRIVAAYLLAMVPLAIAWGALVVFGADLPIEELWQILFFFGLPMLSVFPFVLPSIIHARLAGPEDDISLAAPEAVFS